MAFRFKLNTSQQPQYGYNPVSPLAQAFGNFVNAYMSGPSSYEVDKYQNEAALARLKQEEYTRKFGSYDTIADAFATNPDGTPKYDPATQQKIYAAAARGGLTPEYAGGYGRIYTTTAGAPQSAQDQSVYAVAPWSNTKSAFDESQATEIKKANISAGATIQAANIAETGRMARRYDTPFAASPGSGVYFSPGDPRFGGQTSGSVLVPKTLEPHNVPPGNGVFFDPNDPRFAGRQSGTVPVPKPIDPQSPLGKLMADRDKLPAGHPDRAKYDEAIAKAIAAQAPERNQKIEEYVRQGIPPDTAAAIVDGILAYSTNQEGNRAFVTDKRTGTVTEIPIRQAQGPSVPPPAAPPAADVTQSRAADTTGIGPAVANVLSGTVGQVVPSLASPQVTENQRAIGRINETAIALFSKNTRMPIAEQKRILANAPVVSMGTSATELTSRLAGLREETVKQIQNDTEWIKQPMLTQKARAEAVERLRVAKILLDQIDAYSTGQTTAPPRAYQGSRAGSAFGGQVGQQPEIPTIAGPGDYAKLPPGTQYRAPDGSIRVKR